jgi:hypothetical protein
MERYTDTQEIAFNNLRDSRAIIVDGSVVVAAWDGVAWVDTDTLSTGSYEYFTKGLRLRFTLTGTSYSIEEGEQR